MIRYFKRLSHDSYFVSECKKLGVNPKEYFKVYRIDKDNWGFFYSLNNLCIGSWFIGNFDEEEDELVNLLLETKEKLCQEMTIP